MKTRWGGLYGSRLHFTDFGKIIVEVGERKNFLIT